VGQRSQAASETATMYLTVLKLNAGEHNMPQLPFTCSDCTFRIAWLHAVLPVVQSCRRHAVPPPALQTQPTYRMSVSHHAFVQH
jgi:hypothetical protein